MVRQARNQTAYEREPKDTTTEYRADFAYTDSDGRRVIEDSKGMKTQVYLLKKKLFEAQYAPLRIVEV